MNPSIRHSVRSSHLSKHNSRRFIFRHPALLITLLMAALLAINVSGLKTIASKSAPARRSSGTRLLVGDANPGNNTGNRGITAPAADVSLDKTLDTAAPYVTGQSISYTITVANAGPSTATSIQVTDTPTNLTITNVSGGGCAALPCTIASLASGANVTINVTATIDAPGAFDNSASATPAEFDPDTSNNTDSTGNGGTTCSATQTVINTNDSGAGSLRQALATTCSGGTINFQIPQSDGGFDSLNNRYTITLGGTELLIHQSLTITGPNSGADTYPILISGADQSRVLEVSVPNSSPVSISNLSFVHGLATGASNPNNQGGGIMNTFFSNTTLTNVTVSNSHADDTGGGINNTATLTLYGCSVKDNTSTARGAGIESYGGGTLTAVNSTISGNIGASGGGIDSTISVIVASTLSGNSATGGGGGIRVSGGPGSSLLVVNSTISGNNAYANLANPGGGNAGGILVDNSSPVVITDSTITNNHADANDAGLGSGGGIFINTSTISLLNTIVAGNFLGSNTNTADDIHSKNAGAATGCNNLIGTGGAGGLTNACGNQVGVSDPKLDALGPYGGPTQTHRLQPTSLAIDNGTNVTTLFGNGGSISDSATSINVADASSIPAGVGFLIQIENEQISVTSKSTNTLTVVRAANGTTAASHNDGLAVNPAFDQRGSGFPRKVASAVDIGAFENQCTIPATPTINPSGSASFCVSGTLTSSSATGNQWYKDTVLLAGETNQTLNVTADGSYTVTVTDSGCTSSPSAATTVTINSTPSTPPITPTPAQVCASSTGNSAAGPAGATTYAWSIVNGTITSATNIQTITYTAGASGTVDLTLVVTNAAGCSASNTVNVTINANPATPPITPTPAQVCASSTGNSAAGPAGATTYAWSIVNGTITSATNIQTITYTAGASGTVDLTLVVTNASGCSASNTVNVTINANPATPPITPTPAQVCASSTGNSAAGPAGATTYAWSIVNGTITSATNIQTITYTAGASGTVDLTLVVTNASGCSASNTVNVTINANPATPTITPDGPTTFCAGGSVKLTSSSASGNQWSLNGNPIGGATNQDYTATASGNYTVTVTNGNGCTSAASAPTSVTVNPLPATPTITPGGPTTFCAGGSVTLTSSSAGGNQWFLNGNPIGGATSNTYNATASGNYTVTVTDGNSCTSAPSSPTTVTVNPLPPTPTITPGGPTTFCAGGSVTLTSSSASGNQWFLNGNPIGGATSNTYNATASGNYTVTVTASGCASAASAPTTVTVQPTTITVINASDSGAGSLRQAIADACASGATINFDTLGVFATSQTITLTSGELAVAGNLTINGPTGSGLTISGNNASRIFNVSSGKSLLFSNLTIANGKASQGGGILNAGTLTIVSSTLTNNHTTDGANSSGPGVNGGNGGDGGGIYNTGTLKLINSTISGNQPGNGGDASGTDTSGNGGNGGGIFNSGGSFTSVNTTITNNKTGANGVNTTTTPSPGPFGIAGTGGGIYIASGTVILRNTIVAGNFSVFQTLGPPRAFANSDDDIKGAVDSSSANNLVGVDSGMTGISNGTNGNQVGSSGTPLSAGLTLLSNNGGPTFTHLPQAGSPVLDAGNNMLAKDQNNSDLTTDQRGTGFDRILNGTVEIGAVEVDYGTPGSDADLRVTKSANVDQALPDTNITYTITVSNDGPGAATNATLTDPLPSQVTFVSLSAPGGWSCASPTVGTNGSVNCTNASLPLTSGAVFTLVVHINPGAVQGSFITNQATVSSSAPDTNDENNSAAASTLVIGPTADVTVTKTANTDTARADRDVVYTITVSNSGPTAAASVTLSDPLPSGMTFVSLTPPGGWSCGTPGVGSGGTVTCSNPSLAVTSGQVFTLVAHIPPSAPTGTFYFNQATISSSTSDFNSENNSSSAGITVVACLTNPVVVTTNADSGAGSLRQAIADACAGATITFDMSQVVSPITLTSAELLINQNLTIQGPGANLLTIQRSTAGGTPTFRIFDVASTFTANISGLTITNGNLNGAVIPAADLDESASITPDVIPVLPGGGILNAGTLTLKNIAVNRNSANQAGGISNSGTLTLVNSTVSGNISVAFGGGIVSSGATTIINTTLSGNATNGQGGGVYSDTGATLTVTNTTITNNRSDADGSGAEQGGGIFRNAGTVTLKNTIVAGNFRGTGTTRDDVSGALAAGSSFNLIGDGTNMTGITNGSGGNQVGSAGSPINAMLGALSGNGGPTQTHLLLTGSPAINTGSNANLPVDSFDLDGDSNTAEPLPVDQRGVGFGRVFDSTVDIGALETHYGITATAGTPQNTTINSAFGAVFKATVTESGNVKSGVPVTFTAPASGASGTFPGNSLTVIVNTDAGGVATSPTFTANGSAGNYNVVASLGAGLPTALFALTNNQAATTTAVSSSVNPSSLNQSVTFTATVTSLAGTPTGTVQFKDGGTNLGSPQALNGSGVATFSTSSLSAGAHTITADYSGDANFLSSSGALATAQLVGSVIRFSADNYGTTEGAGHATITVERIGDLSSAVTIDYSTPDDSAAMTVLPCSTANGVASPRCDFETALGTLRWGPGDGSARTFTVLINQDVFVEGPETLTLTLSNPTGGAGFVTPGATSVAATLTIADDLTEPATNPIDDTETFVRQQYRDFLNREPDAAGLAFWKDNIDKCNDDNRRPAGLTVDQCIERYRVHTSAAFFLSVEFQNTGFYVERLYKAGYGDINSPTVPVPVRFTNFLRDTQEVGAGVIVGQGNWETQIDNNKSAFALSFVQRPEFLSRYPNAISATSFVDSLNANAGGVLTDSERSDRIAELTPNPADPSLRASVLRKIADNALLQQQEFNRAFVLIEYFGYLRRNPDAAPEPNLNFEGYNFWLNKLNHLNGDGDIAELEMVKSFIKSAEYRNRFGP